jgi:hypothetical protein
MGFPPWLNQDSNEEQTAGKLTVFIAKWRREVKFKNALGGHRNFQKTGKEPANEFRFQKLEQSEGGERKS